MSRKDYVAIAQAFADTYRNLPSEIGADGASESGQHAITRAAFESVVDGLRDRIADVLACDNPRFDRGRFTRAARGGE